MPRKLGNSALSEILYTGLPRQRIFVILSYILSTPAVPGLAFVAPRVPGDATEDHLMALSTDDLDMPESFVLNHVLGSKQR